MSKKNIDTRISEDGTQAIAMVDGSVIARRFFDEPMIMGGQYSYAAVKTIMDAVTNAAAEQVISTGDVVSKYDITYIPYNVVYSA